MYKRKDILSELRSDLNYAFYEDSWHYVGVLIYPRMPRLAKVGYGCWMGQKARCENQNHRAHKYYGAKGIEVKWSARRCIAFYINSLVQNKKDWTKPVISRIGDIGNYCTKNCVLKESVANAKEIKVTDKRRESSKRVGSLTGKKNGKKREIPIVLINISDSLDKLYFSSAKAASREIKKSTEYVSSRMSLNKNVIFKGNRYKALRMELA